MSKMFLHGVPNTTDLWMPLVQALDIDREQYSLPALPGFGCPIAQGFSATKDGYLKWLIDYMQREYDKNGPLDIVGHDWGGILCLRAAQLRPDLIRSWAVANAVLVPGYQWHSTARLWQTPILGEIMMMAGPKTLADTLKKAGMPPALATTEVQQVDRAMKRAILSLYRSAKKLSEGWGSEVADLPKNGLVIWGDRDPFVQIKFARAFCDQHDVPLHVEQGAGHWSISERADAIAARLNDHWKSAFA